jgi:two-component system response regulator HydG
MSSRICPQNPIETVSFLDRLGGFVGASPSIQQLYRQIQTVSHHNFPILILGESGTGKELVARLIHDQTPRRPQPFAPVDCSALVPTLIESELFGHVRGAFTGADRSRIGLLQAASGGTLFLDEVGELPLHCQAKLLRALQEREIRPVGSTELIPIDVRVIAATNRNLESEIKAGRFRQDLYFRLNVLQIKLPALRDRQGDIPLLVDSFLQKFADLASSTRSVSEDAMRCLLAYSWPGNVRELENAIEHALALGDGPTVEVIDLPLSLQNAPFRQVFPEESELFSLYEIERRAIFRALTKTHGDRLAAAQILHIGKTTLYRKLKEYSAEPQHVTHLSP